MTKHKWELHWVAPDRCKVWIWNLWILIDFNSERHLADDVRTSTIKSNTEMKRHTSGTSLDATTNESYCWCAKQRT